MRLLVSPAPAVEVEVALILLRRMRCPLPIAPMAVPPWTLNVIVPVPAVRIRFERMRSAELTPVPPAAMEIAEPPWASVTSPRFS